MAAIAAATALPLPELLRLDQKVVRNQMSLKMRVGGDAVDFGRGLFPFSSLLNHSCHANTAYHPISSGHAMVVRALRDIEIGEEATDSYIAPSTIGAQRSVALERSHGFVCSCERCAAPKGSELHRLECWAQVVRSKE